MSRREIVNYDKNSWLITMVKTIDNSQVIFYRVLNLYTYKTLDIPAFKVFDEIINNKMNIINARCSNNQLVVLTNSGYSGTDDIIVIDEFDREIPSFYEWSLKDYRGSDMMKRYDPIKNIYSPSMHYIDSSEKIAWTCEHGHTIKIDFQTYVSSACICPICEAKKHRKVLSFKQWAKLTCNEDILEYYRSCQLNKLGSADIPYDSKRKVWWHKDGENVQFELNKVTVSKKLPPFKSNIEQKPINLSRG